MTNILSIIGAILLFGAIIFFHELGHFLTAKKAGVLIHEFAIGMGPTIFKREKDGIVYSVRLLPVGGFVAMEGEDDDSNNPRAISNCSVFTQVKVFIAGSLTNLFMGYVILLVLVIMTGFVGTTIVSTVPEGTAAFGVLQEGDEIIKVNNSYVFTSNDITRHFLKDRDGYMEFDVERNGEMINDIPVQFKMMELDGINFIDLDFKVYGKDAEFIDYITYPINWGISIVLQVWDSLADLLTGRYSLNALSGPVGVTSVIVEATQINIEAFLQMAALITINIGVFNLLPLPILDGGRIVILLIEAVTKRKISRKLIEKITIASVILLVGLMLVVTVNDIINLFN